MLKQFLLGFKLFAWKGEVYIPYELYLVNIIAGEHFVHTFPTAPFQFVHLSLKKKKKL